MFAGLQCPLQQKWQHAFWDKCVAESACMRVTAGVGIKVGETYLDCQG